MNETYSQVIAAPVTRVWELIDNHENLRLWMDGLEDTTYPDGLDRSRPIGTRFVQRIREGGRVAEYQGVVTAYEHLRHLGIEIGNRAFTMDVDYRLTPVEQGTRLDYSANMKRGGRVHPDHDDALRLAHAQDPAEADGQAQGDRGSAYASPLLRASSTRSEKRSTSSSVV